MLYLKPGRGIVDEIFTAACLEVVSIRYAASEHVCLKGLKQHI